MRLLTRRPAIMLVANLVLVAAWPVGVAHAQGTHSGHGPADLQGLATGASHGAAQAAAVFLAGLATFVALVWLPSVGTGDGAGLFARWTWVLFGLLTVAGVVEVSLYAVRASGQPFSHDLFGQALFETRVATSGWPGSGSALWWLSPRAGRPGRGGLFTGGLRPAPGVSSW